VNIATRAGLDQHLSVLSDGPLNLARGRLHEFYAADGRQDGAGLALAVLLAARIGGEAQILWLRLADRRRPGAAPYGPGLAELGIDPGRLILVEAKDAPALLRAAGDAARCGGLGALLIETRGRWPELDLTASRRLLLATERSGVTLLLARSDAAPLPSAAETRWQVSAAPSRAVDAEAPGQPAFIVELLRRRGGPAGSRWRLEWNREHASFEGTALPGAVVSLPPGGTAGDRARAGLRSVA
jgi:protein ImuA